MKSNSSKARAQPGGSVLALLLWWSCTVLVLAASAQVPAGLAPETMLSELTITHFSTEAGLPASSLTDALQTADGYLWLASYEGVFRFDGRQFTAFDRFSSPALEASGILELAEAPGGELWLGTQGSGVAVFRQGRFEAPAEALPYTVRTILLDDGGAWAGTGDHGAFRYRGGRWRAAEAPELRDVTIRDILRDRRGVLWFATEGSGLIRLDGAAATRYSTAAGLMSNATSSLCEAGDGSIWVGTEDGLNRFAGGEIESFAELAGAEIYRLYLDAYQNLWIASEQGLFRRNAVSKELERLESADGRIPRSISAIAFGREGEVWLASYRDGLYRLAKGKFDSYTTERGLATQRVNALYETSGGDVLVGGDGGRIDVVSGGEVAAVELGEALPDVRVRDILKDRRGRLWIASYAGLLEVADGNRRWHTIDSGLPSNQVRFVFEDRAGSIWAATRNAGLVEVTGDGRVDKSSGLSSDFVLSVTEGPGDELLIGTYEGLSVLAEDGTIVGYGRDDGLPGGLVFNSYADTSGAVWLATNGGLARLFRGEIRALTAEQGLPAESIFDIQEDDRGQVWMSSSSGVIAVSKEQLIAAIEGTRARVDALVYDERDGLSARECTGAAKILAASDGRLWFPTLGGVSVVDPGDIPVNRVEPPVEISRFAVDGVAVDGAGPARLAVGPGKKEFVFEFVALSFLAPSKVRVRFRLNGFDDGWVEARGERAVRYTNLAPGDYSFRVIAANNDGIWNREGAGLRFRVEPFFFQHPFFLVAVALLLALGGGGLYRWRMEAVRERNLQLEAIVGELEVRNAEMERFTYTVSHDLKSPLVTIQGFLGFLERGLEAGDAGCVRRDVERIKSAASTMARQLDELLELSRIGRVVHPPEDLDLGGLVRQAMEQLSTTIEARGAKVEIAPDLPQARGDRLRLQEVLVNLIENAVLHSGEPEPRVEVGWRRDGRVLFVRDHGVGIDRRYHEKIFGLFERLDAEAEGTGVGLALVKRIVEAHGGRVWVESEGVGQGATFCLTLQTGDA